MRAGAAVAADGEQTMGGWGAPAAEKPRDPPHNFDAEQALLGAILTSSLAYDRVAGFLLPEHFANEIHGMIFGACRTLIESGKQANPLTLKFYFESVVGVSASGTPGFMSEPGETAKYLARLAASATTIINAADYGSIVYDLYLRRRLLDAVQEAESDAYISEPGVTAETIIETVDQKLANLMERRIDGGFVQIGGPTAEAIGKADAARLSGSRITGVPMGIAALDRMTGGLQPGELIVIAARPSMGKSTLAWNIGHNAAQKNHKVAEFSLEMTAQQVAQMELARMTGISAMRQRVGDVSEAEIAELHAARVTLDGLPIQINDTSGLTVPGIKAQGRMLRRRKQMDLCIIDYLQFIRSPGRVENRTQEVSEITRGLKDLAKSLNVPVVLLSQLNRGVEAREDKRPMLADLRESGSIEQDADVVMFIYRHEYYLSRRKPQKSDDDAYIEWEAEMMDWRNIAEVIIAKQRMGPTTTVRLYYDGEQSLFRDLDSEHGR